MLFRVIVSLKFSLLKWRSVIYKYSSEKHSGFASIEVDENQSLCTKEHTHTLCCFQTDTASINSHRNTHSLILSSLTLCLLLPHVARHELGPHKFNLQSNSISKTWSKLRVCWALCKQARTQCQHGYSRNLIIAVPSSNRFVLNSWVVLIDFS